VIETIKGYLTKNYGYDGGHGLMGVLIGLTLFGFGTPVWLAGLLGGLLYAVPKEISDIKKHGGLRWSNIHTDNVCDLVSYQLSWPAVLMASHQPILALLVLMVIGVTYLYLVHQKTKDA